MLRSPAGPVGSRLDPVLAVGAAEAAQAVARDVDEDAVAGPSGTGPKAGGVLAGEEVGKTDCAACRPALNETRLRSVEMQVPGSRRVPMKMRAGATLFEQDVEHFRGVVLAVGSERGEDLAQTSGEPLKISGLVDVELGCTCPGLAQRRLRTGSHLLGIAGRRDGAPTGHAGREGVYEGRRDIDSHRHMTVEMSLIPCGAGW